MLIGGGGGVGSDKIPTDKTTYLPNLIWDKIVSEKMQHDKTISRQVFVNKYVLDYGYSETKANKWIDTMIKLNHLTEKSGFIEFN